MTFSVALSLSLFAFAFALAIDASSISVPPSSAEIEAFRIDVLDLIDSFGNADDASDAKPLIGSVLRLVFHDCAGPFNDGTTAASNDNARRLCDGCIDLDKGDHGGLFELAVAPIEVLCLKYASVMNRADCWATTGTVALEYSVVRAREADPNNDDVLPTLPYFFGRAQCLLSPNAITGDDAGTEFPLAHLGWDPLMTFFRTFFSFSLREATAIMGAHTVGRAHSAASGFDGKWTRDSFAFNNAFFKELIDADNEWDQIPAPPPNPNENPFPQWRNDGADAALMMLNADMSLVMAMEHRGSDGRPHIDEATGEVRCRWRHFTLRSNTEICDAEDSLSIVEEYARDNQRFLEDFAGAWTEVVTLNQRDLHRVDVAPFRDARVDVAVPTSTP